MSSPQVTSLAAHVSDAARATTTRVVLVCAGAAWVALGVPWAGGDGEVGTLVHDGHVIPPVAEVGNPWSLAWLTYWMLMVVAMMWPLAIPAVGAVSRSSFRGWRTLLGAACLATVTLLWLAVGFAGALLARVLGVTPDSIWWQLAFVCLALMAFRSARRGRLLEQCLRLPALAPGGRRGVVTAARVGLLTWRRCVILCGPVMLAMTVGHSAVLMLCASLAAWWEAWHPRSWRDRVPVALVSAGGVGLVVSVMLDMGVGHG